MEPETSNVGFDGLNYGEERVLEVFAEQVGLKPMYLDVKFSIVWYLKSEGMSTSEEDVLHPVHLGVGEEEDVRACQVSGLVGVEGDLDMIIILLFHLHLNLFEPERDRLGQRHHR